MNESDLIPIYERINGIMSTGVHPSILLNNLSRVNLRDAVAEYPITACSIMLLYNMYKGRQSSSGTIGMSHIIASMANTDDDMDQLMSIIENDNEIASLAPSISIIQGMRGQDIQVYGTPMIPVHEYVRQRMGTMSVTAIYNGLKSSLSVRGRPLSMKAVVGGIAYGLGDRVPHATLYERISSLNPPGAQRMTMNEFADSISWYRAQVTNRPINPTFYRDVLEAINKMETIQIDTYEPQLDSQELIAVPTRPIDTIDTVGSTTTSVDLPAIISNVGNQKVIKTNDAIEKQIPWFYQVRPNTMRIITRVTRFPNRYDMATYSVMRNQLHLSSRRRHIPIPEIMNNICAATTLRTLPAPTVTSNVYTFITNFIDDGHNAVGIDRNVMAWLITNPPPEYRATNIHKYVFVREDMIPNSLKEHVNIHIQLGADKMFLSFSRQESTSGTIIENDGEMISFPRGQPFLMVRINSCPSIHHARICQQLYRHIITMYVRHYSRVRDEILKLGVNMPNRPPSITPLRSEPTSDHYRLIHRDPVLYKYTSTIPIDRLPIPIDRSEVGHWRRQGYGVIRIPTVVMNNVNIKFESSSTIWLRTPRRTMAWSLHRKTNGMYVPVPRGSYRDDINVRVNDDWTLTELHDRVSGIGYILNVENNMAHKMHRYANTSNVTSIFLAPVTGGGTIYRYAISNNLFYNMNYITGKGISIEDVAQYAYLCKQSCWDQDIHEIKEDIMALSIDPDRHRRAIEQAFQMNIFFVMEDPVEPYLLKPRHAYFYLHNSADPSWPTVIMHTMQGADGFFTIIAKDTSGTPSSFTFPTTRYLDSKMAESNIVDMITPEDGSTIRVAPTQIQPIIGAWRAQEQVLDSYGKVRAINYSRGTEWVTLSIGFAPIQVMAIGTVRAPSARFRSDMASIRGPYSDVVRLIMNPSDGDGFQAWQDMERSARILRVVCHLLYSLEDMDIDEFMDYVTVSNITTYDLSNLRRELPPVEDPDDAWAHFASAIPSMVHYDDGDKMIMVPDEGVKASLRDHMKATPRIGWPTYMPSYVRYSWDVHAHEGETVFMRDQDLIQYMVLERTPTITATLREYTTAYLLQKHGHLFLVQLAKNMGHAAYIIWSWINRAHNPGYNVDPEPIDIDVQEFQLENIRNMDTPGVVRQGDSIFVLMPLS